MKGSHHVRKRPERGEPRYAASLTALLRDVSPGCEIVAVTGGEWSLAELLLGLIDKVGGDAEVDIATWTAADAAIRGMDALFASDKIRRIRWLVDRSFPSRQPKYARRLIDTFGPDSIRLARTHAKWLAVSAGDWRIAVRTSMNLNSNPRTEIAEISDDPAMHAFLVGITDRHWLEIPPGFPDAASIRKGQRAATVTEPADPDDALADLDTFLARQFELL